MKGPPASSDDVRQLQEGALEGPPASSDDVRRLREGALEGPPASSDDVRRLMSRDCRREGALEGTMIGVSGCEPSEAISLLIEAEVSEANSARQQQSGTAAAIRRGRKQ